jgi:hypothetical protein
MDEEITVFHFTSSMFTQKNIAAGKSEVTLLTVRAGCKKKVVLHKMHE